MHPTRRGLLGLGTALPLLMLGACAPSPVVTGAPGEAFTAPPTVPVQADDATQAAEWTNQFMFLVTQVQTNATDWDVSEAMAAWAEGAAAQAEAQLARLLSEDPLNGDGEAVFELPELAPEPAPDLASLTAAMDEKLAEGVTLLGALAAAADAQPRRLFFTSLAAAAQGNRSRSLPPVPGEASPILFPSTTLDTSLGVALTHVWALLQGLEFAIARFPAGEDRDLARAQLGPARSLRDRLLESMGSGAPGQAVNYEMPNGMSDPAEIRDALASLSAGVMDAWARVMAAGPGDLWLDPMAEQVTRVQSWGGQLPYWPGWAQV